MIIAHGCGDVLSWFLRVTVKPGSSKFAPIGTPIAAAFVPGARHSSREQTSFALALKVAFSTCTPFSAATACLGEQERVDAEEAHVLVNQGARVFKEIFLRGVLAGKPFKAASRPPACP